MSMTSVLEVHELRSRTRPAAVAEIPGSSFEPIIRTARDSDVDAIHRLVSQHLAEGRLLPRSRDEIARRVGRFIVATDDDRIVGCADLAPLGRRVAEVRSLVVENGARSCGVGRQLVHELERRAAASGFETLTAFTHTPGYFVRLGFSIVPHAWIPEKIEADCRTCAQFPHCGQYAVMLPLFGTHTACAPAPPAHA